MLAFMRWYLFIVWLDLRLSTILQVQMEKATIFDYLVTSQRVLVDVEVINVWCGWMERSQQTLPLPCATTKRHSHGNFRSTPKREEVRHLNFGETHLITLLIVLENSLSPNRVSIVVSTTPPLSPRILQLVPDAIFCTPDFILRRHMRPLKQFRSHRHLN